MRTAEVPDVGSAETGTVNASCARHSGMCAYRGNEADRCRWCHSTWHRIIGSGWHSCEQSSVWRGLSTVDKARRIGEVIREREKAAQTLSEMQRSTHITHRAWRTNVPQTGLSESVKGSQGTRAIVLVECTGCPRRFGVMFETLANARCSQCRRRVSYVGPGEPQWNSQRRSVSR